MVCKSERYLSGGTEVCSRAIHFHFLRDGCHAPCSFVAQMRRAVLISCTYKTHVPLVCVTCPVVHHAIATTHAPDRTSTQP